jgi:hypothetical protein
LLQFSNFMIVPSAEFDGDLDALSAQFKLPLDKKL